jgi:hypothetical protein
MFIIFLQSACFGQVNKARNMDIWDSLYMRHQQEEDAYNVNLKKALKSTDTLTTKDSLIISFISINGDLLKRIVYNLTALGCVDFVRFKYYNEKGQLAYIKKYKQTCPRNKTVSDKDSEFHRIHYERFEYDAMGRLILHIDTFADRPYKEEYIYNLDGTVKRVSKKIPGTDFWKTCR